MRKARALLLVVFTSMSISAIACTSASTQCDCADNTVQIHIPADLAAGASAPMLSGVCAGVTPTCTQQAAAGGCETYAFTPTVAGKYCQIDIDLPKGRVFDAQLKIVQETGCCAGFFVEPLSAGDVEVPEGT